MNEEVLIPINDKYRIINGENNSFILQESYHSEKGNTLLCEIQAISAMLRLAYTLC